VNNRWAEVVAHTRAEVGVAAESWITVVPKLLPRLAERWGLALGEPFPVENGGYVLPARMSDDTGVIVKIEFPRRDMSFAQEVAGLQLWNGQGMIRLLDFDAELGAQLLERAVPGTQLWDEPDEVAALGVVASVLRRLWSVDPPTEPEIVTVSTRAVAWAASIEHEWAEAREPFDRDLLEDARATMVELARDAQATQVLLHGDLHQGNVLAAEREPWLAIDPQPAIGERAWDLRAPLCDRPEDLLADPDPIRRLMRRLDVLCAPLGVEAERAVGWAFAIQVDWCIGSFGTPSGDDWGRTQLAVARLLRRIRG
jgi:streptomycin 6-kinase